MKHGRRPNEAKSRKNVEMDLVGDKIGRVHLGKQDLSQLQTRKMKGLKRSHAELDDEVINGETNGEVEEDLVSEDEDMVNGGMELDGEEDGRSSLGGSGDELSIGESSDEDMADANELPKRQKLS